LSNFVEGPKKVKFFEKGCKGVTNITVFRLFLPQDLPLGLGDGMM
jgi:hypothetical protein